MDRKICREEIGHFVIAASMRSRAIDLISHPKQPQGRPENLASFSIKVAHDKFTSIKIGRRCFVKTVSLHLARYTVVHTLISS